MAKKKRQPHNQALKQEEQWSLADQLEDDLLQQLRLAKKQLVVEEQERAEQQAEKKREERRQREKNKTFEELLEEYGDRGSKY